MQFTHEHLEIQKTLKRFIDEEINPHVDEWEAAEMFPAHIRALGVALPFAIANAIFGGSAEYVALYLKDIGHERWFYIYISGLAALSLIAYVRMRETKTASLIEED